MGVHPLARPMNAATVSVWHRRRSETTQCVSRTDGITHLRHRMLWQKNSDCCCITARRRVDLLILTPHYPWTWLACTGLYWPLWDWSSIIIIIIIIITYSLNKKLSYRRDRAVGWVSFGQKLKTIFCRQYMSISNHC